MAGELQAGRTVAATVVGGLVGGLALAAVVGYGSEAVLEPEADGLVALLYAMLGLMVGATLGAAVALALVFRGAPADERRATVLSVVVAGVLWGVAWVVVPPLLWAGIVILPAGALVGRWLTTR